MRAWRADRFGEPREVLSCRDIDLPSPPPGFVAIKVAAAGVALPDVLMLKGRYPTVTAPPVSPGMEAAGTITAVGDGVNLKVGQRVMTTTASTSGWGGFAEYCLADATKAFPVPRGMSDVDAAGFSLPYKTAHIALVHRCKLAPGETLLVLGAAGSSGGAAVQLGKALGARVIAAASSPEKVQFARQCGADEVIDYKAENLSERIDALTGGRGVNVVFDPVGGSLAGQALSKTARLGRFGIIGFASGDWVKLPPHDLIRGNVSAVGVFAGDMTQAEVKQTFDELTQLAEAGKIRSLVSRSFAFADVQEALALQASGNFLGKLAIGIAAN